MQYVFVIEDEKVKDAYEFHPEEGFMVRKEEWTSVAVGEIEDKLKTQFRSVSKLREVDNEIVYEVK
jgi:exosome complex RNA-binding protein Csl4